MFTRLILLTAVFVLGTLVGAFVVRNNEKKAIRLLDEAKLKAGIEMAKLKVRG